MATDLASLEARIRRLEDIEAIRRLRLDYHACVNRHAMPDATPLYTDDAFIDFGPTAQARGPAEIRALYERLNANVDMIKQFAANHEIDVAGDEATGHAWVDARYGQGDVSIIACASYADRYRRTPEGWKFSEMVVTIHFGVPVQQGWAGAKAFGM
jgi:ketosteroid isomerase-like protein